MADNEVPIPPVNQPAQPAQPILPANDANPASMPSRGHASAPKFDSARPRELSRYFAELALLFQKHNVLAADQRKSFACHYVDIESAELWELLPEFAAAFTYPEFVAAVTRLYPGASDDRKWTMSDMDKLTGEYIRVGIHSAADLAEYYRAFFTITQYLRSRGRLSEAEQSRAFIRGFQSQLWSRIARRLEIVNPLHNPDDPHALANIHEAAKYVLHGTATLPMYHSAIVAPTVAAPPAIKTEDLDAMFTRLTASLVQALQPQVVANQAQVANRSAAAPVRQGPRREECDFCGEIGHFIRDCGQVVNAIAEGKVKRNIEGRVVLPGGGFVPRTIKGQWLRDRVNEWHRQNPNQLAVVEIAGRNNAVGQQLMLEVKNDVTTAFQLTAVERIAALEQEIYALRTKEVFDGVHVPVRKKPGNPTGLGDAATRVGPPKKKMPPAVPAEATTDDAAPAVATDPTKATPPSAVHPFRSAPDASYTPPTTRNFGLPNAKPPVAKDKELAYRTYAPVQDRKIADDVYARSMQTPCVTLTQQELLSLSPEVRQKVRDVVTPKRVVADNRDMATAVAKQYQAVTIEDEPDEDDPMPFAEPVAAISHVDIVPVSVVVPDPYECYLSTLSPGELAEPLTVAKVSHALRSVFLLVNNQEHVESIIDPGCQIVAMSEAVCHDLALPYDPTITISVQSANGDIDKSLGLARNVPCRIGPITLYLQIHVIRNPAYDVLLGRPFDVLTESLVKNYANEDQTITICDPNTGRRATIPTLPRGLPRHRIASRSPPPSSDVNFRD